MARKEQQIIIKAPFPARLYDSKETRMKKNWKLPFRFGRPWLRWIQSLWRHKCGKSSRVASKCRWHVLNENEAGTCASSSIWSAKQKKHQKSLKNAAQKNNKNSQFPSVPKKSRFYKNASEASYFFIIQIFDLRKITLLRAKRLPSILFFLSKNVIFIFGAKIQVIVSSLSNFVGILCHATFHVCVCLFCVANHVCPITYDLLWK